MRTGCLPAQRDWRPTAPCTVPAELLPAPRAAEHDRLPVPRQVRRRTKRLVLGGLLNLAALLGLLMISLTVYAATHHLHPLVVRSGSMEPLIPTGGMVLVQTIPAAAVRVGDVVAVKRPDGVTVTHRVQSLSRSGDLAQLVLKGDANKAKDPDPVTVATAGRLVWSAPLIGRLAAWSASARGGFALGCVVTAVLLSLRRRSP